MHVPLDRPLQNSPGPRPPPPLIRAYMKLHRLLRHAYTTCCNPLQGGISCIFNVFCEHGQTGNCHSIFTSCRSCATGWARSRDDDGAHNLLKSGLLVPLWNWLTEAQGTE